MHLLLRDLYNLEGPQEAMQGPLAQKVVFKHDGSKRIVPITAGSTVAELLKQLGQDRAESQDGFVMDASTPLEGLLGAVVYVSKDSTPPPTVKQQQPLPEEPGHLFIVQSDIRVLLTDAWLVPINGWESANRHWVPNNDDGDFGKCSETLAGKTYVRRVNAKSWPATTKSSQPVPYGCRMPKLKKVELMGDVVGEFVDAALDDLRGSKTAPRNRRHKYLFSVPLLATGMGGFRGMAGDVVARLVPELEKLTKSRKVDLVLVVQDPSIFSMLQTFRRRDANSQSHQWTLLKGQDKVSVFVLLRISSS